MSDTSKFGWADLPKGLLEMISKRLDSRIEVCRFRAVCSSWRSTTSPFYKQYPRTPLKLPDPIPAHAYLTQVILCRAELVDDGEDSSSSSSVAWLTKVEESIHGELQLLAPLSNRQLRSNAFGMVPKMLNLLNIRLLEVYRAYSLTLVRGCPVFGIKKLVLFPSSAHSDSNNKNEHGFLVIFQEGKLGYWGFAKEEWKLLDETNFHYDDILVYKGQYYVVDQWGTISWIDSSFNVIQYSPPLFGCGDEKSLVESGGDLYVIDRYFDEERRWNDDLYYNLNNDLEYPRRYHPVCRAKTVNIRVYKLDEEWGTWVDVRSLDDKIFVLGNECCFSVSAKDFFACEGNCIYFIDPADADRQGEFSGCDARVFDLGSGSIGKVAHFPGRAHIFLNYDLVGNQSEESTRLYKIIKEGKATTSDHS